MQSLRWCELPALVYQLLVLASKGGHKQLLLEGLVGLFNTLDRDTLTPRGEEEGG